MFSIYRRIFDLLDARERRRFGLLCLMAFAMGVFELLGVASILPFLTVLADPAAMENRPILAKAAAVLGIDNSQDLLVTLGMISIAFIVTGAFVKSFTIFCISRFAQMREYSLGKRLIEVYLRQPYIWFLTRHSADLAKMILSEVGAATNGVILPAMRVLAFSVVALLLLIFLMIISPMAAIGGMLIIGGGYALTFLLTRRYLSRIGRARVRANTARYAAAQEAFGGVKDVKLRGLEAHYLERFRVPARRFAHCKAVAQVIGEIPRHFLEALIFGSMIVFVLVLMTKSGDQATVQAILPTLGVLAVAGARIFPAVQRLYQSASQMRFNRAALDVLHADFFDRHAGASSGKSGGVGSLRFADRLTFKDVHYSYPGADQPALRGLDLEIRAQTTVGLVGASGAGKTTAVDVLLGLLAPQQGVITVDGVELGPANIRAWQQRLGYVPQHIFLTDNTVATNIAIGLKPEEIDMAAVERAARIAELHEFVINELPEGYRTKVGERGVRLSGGQRQRIGIARALYHDPDVIILDEATSALDNLTERAVMDAVHNLAHAKTIVLIAHRLSTVRNCDTIFVLEDGRCTAADTYDALVEHHGTFRRLALSAG